MNKKVGNYILTAELAKGRRSTVYLATSISEPNSFFVVKNYSKRNNQLSEAELRAQLQNELLIMANSDHPNVIKFIEFNETANNFYLFLPYFPGGNLEAHLQSAGCLSQGRALNWLRQIIEGLLALHRQRVFIKEFSLRCVHIRGEHLAIGSFGRLYRALSRSIMTPPEYFFGKAESYGKEKGCVWSLGVAFYKMLFGKHPFSLDECASSKAADLIEFVRANSGLNLRFPEAPTVTEACRQFLRAMIQIDPALRIDLADCLSDPVFVDSGEADLPLLKLEKPWLDTRLTEEESPPGVNQKMQLDSQR